MKDLIMLHSIHGPMHYVVRLVIKFKILLVCQFDMNQARMNNPSISTECLVNFFN